MKYKLGTAIAVIIIALLAMFMFNFFFTIIAIVVSLSIVGWACGIPITVKVKRGSHDEVRKYRWFSRIQ